jgi:hypothetical protein
VKSSSNEALHYAIFFNLLLEWEERSIAYSAFVGKSEGKRPLGKPRRRWEDNIKMAER